MVYSETIRDVNHLKQRIRTVIDAITPDVLHKVWEEVKFRLDLCRATRGAHVELQ